MALVFKDRVKETTTTTGTGTITLAGAVSGFQAFSEIGDGNTTYYAIVSGTDWEVGIGTYTLSGTTLSRDTILESSNAGSAISLTGTSTVFCTYAAEKSVYRNSNDQINVTASGLIFSDSTVQTTAAAVSGDNVSIFVNDTGYLTNTSSDFTYVSGVAVYGSGHTLQTVTDNGNNTTNSILTSGNVTATTGYFDTFDMTLLENGSQPPHLEGRLFYDSENHTVTMYNDEPDISMQIGQELYVRVRNNTPDDIPNGSVVRINGSHGNSAPTIVLASADSETNSQVAGFATHTIGSNSFGYISTFGLVRDVDTDGGMSDGDELFLSVTSGEYVNVDPGIPYYSISLGRIIVSHPSNGSIFVNIGKRKLSGGDLKSVIALNQSGVPFVTYLANTNGSLNAGGVTTVSDFVYDSGNSALYVNNKQVITSGDNVSLLNNDAGYLTTHPAISAASDSDNSGRTYIQDLLLDSYGHVTGISTATETVVDTDTTYTAGSGLQLNGTTFDALTATTSTSGITTLTNTIDATETKALTPKAVNDAGYITGTGNVNQVAIFDTTTSVSGAQGIEIETTGDPGLDIFRKSGQTTTLVNIYTESTGILTVIDENGYIGIGTGDPTYHLQVEGTGDFDTIRFSDGSLQTTSASGAVIGPASSTDNAIVVFDGTTGKLVKESTANIDAQGTLTVESGIRLGSNEYMGFDSYTVDGVTNSSPQQIYFLGDALTGTYQSTYLFMIRLVNITSNETTGSSYFVRKTGTTSTSNWESFEWGKRVTSSGECPEIYIDTVEPSGGAVKVRLDSANPAGGDKILAHMTAWRVDRGDNDILAIAPESIFAHYYDSSVGSNVRKVFPINNTPIHFGLRTTNPTEALYVADKAYVQSSFCGVASSSEAGSMTLDFDAANVFNVTLTGNVTSVTFSNANAGQKVLINVKQDSAGGYTITGGDWSATKWTDNTAPTLSTASGTVDTIGIMVPRASTYYGYTVGTGIIDV
jgi:hypothetical protein